MIDTDWSFKWLLSNMLKAESEGFMIVLQDQVTATRSHTALFGGSQILPYVEIAAFSWNCSSCKSLASN